MYTKSDIHFEKLAIDPARRRAAIADLSKRRTWLVCLSAISLVVSFYFSWAGKGSSQLIVTMIMLMMVNDTHSEIRLLTVVDRLQKGFDEKPVA